MPKITLTKKQWERLSEILGNLGLVFFASVVLPYILEQPKLPNVISGLVLAVGCWIASILLSNKSR